jgi:hypothetical protein
MIGDSRVASALQGSNLRATVAAEKGIIFQMRVTLRTLHSFFSSLSISSLFCFSKGAAH